ncbi:MAG: hypothetical protein V1772_03165 [Chloroflexota bacterium]
MEEQDQTERVWLPHPYRHGLYATVALSAVGLGVAVVGAALSAAGAWSPAVAIVGAAFAALFALVGLIAWLFGLVQRHRAQIFWASDRPLVRWTYTEALWRRIKEAAWMGERDDWRPQWGCLTALLAVAGALAGGMVGADDSLGEALKQGAVGLLAGGGVGGLLGGAVALANHSAARLARAEPQPGRVALGPHEVYMPDSYFRGDGLHTYIIRAALEPAEAPVNLATLRLDIMGPLRPHGPREQQWDVLVPPEYEQAVAAASERLTALPRR